MKRNSSIQMILVLALGVFIGYAVLPQFMRKSEGFQGNTSPSCDACKKDLNTCSCPEEEKRPICPSCLACPPMPDMTKYVLKSSIPPPEKCPDLSLYMLKTECPPVPDMSQYVLKASIPKQQPVIVDSSSCKKPCGDCPPCPRPRCPEIKCPPPTVCPACPPCPRATCPDTVVKCKAEESAGSTVRPYLSPLSMPGFGM